MSTPDSAPEPTAAQHPASERRPWPLLLVGLALIGILALAVLTSTDEGPALEAPEAADAPDQDSPGTGEVTEEMREVGEDLARRDTDDPFALGDTDAPVVMIVWSDFHCPYCGQWVRETQSELVEDYVEAGELRLEWRELPLQGEGSTTLAQASYAAGEQEQFWEFHDTYFAEERERYSGEELESEITEIAEEIGIDAEQLASDMDSEQAEEHVELDAQEGQALGMTSTPAFLVNGEAIIGAQPTPVFVEAVDAALEEAG